jgi:hypothetical protein
MFGLALSQSRVDWLLQPKPLAHASLKHTKHKLMLAALLHICYIPLKTPVLVGYCRYRELWNASLVIATIIPIAPSLVFSDLLTSA